MIFLLPLAYSRIWIQCSYAWVLVFPAETGESQAVWSPDSRLGTWWHWDMSRFCHVIVTCDGDTGPRCHPTLGRCLHWCRPDTGEMPISGCSSKLVPLLSAGHLLSGATAVKWKIDLTVCCLVWKLSIVLLNTSRQCQYILSSTK